MNLYEQRKLQKRNSKFLKELRKKPTEAEKMVGLYLLSRGIYFIFQKGFLRPFHRIVDFYLPGRMTIIEVDGGYHNNEEILNKDSVKDYRWINERNCFTVRIRNEDVYSGKFKEILEPIIKDKIIRDEKIARCPNGWKKQYAHI